MKKRSLRWIWWVACALWLALIFRQSSMPAVQSKAESGGLLSVVAKWLPFMTEHLLRKLAHFGEFGILGLLLSQCLRKNCAYPSLAGLLCALSDETIQLFVQGRSSQVSDVWVDFSGVVCAVLFTFALRWLIKRNKR